MNLYTLEDLIKAIDLGFCIGKDSSQHFSYEKQKQRFINLREPIKLEESNPPPFNQPNHQRGNSAN